MQTKVNCDCTVEGDSSSGIIINYCLVHDKAFPMWDTLEGLAKNFKCSAVELGLGAPCTERVDIVFKRYCFSCKARETLGVSV